MPLGELSSSVNKARIHAKAWKKARFKWRFVLDMMAMLIVAFAVYTMYSYHFHGIVKLIGPGYHIDEKITISSQENDPMSLRLWGSKLFRNNKVRYISSPVERYILNHVDELGYNTGNKRNASGCKIWKESKNNPIYGSLKKYRREVKKYANLINAFQVSIKHNTATATTELHISRKYTAGNTTMPHQHTNKTNELSSHSSSWDIRKFLDEGICEKINLHPKGLQGIFRSGELSHISERHGFLEPILPPMRHPDTCHHFTKYFMNPLYLVHDFAAMCRQLKPTSRIVFFDLGASLDFHLDMGIQSPALYLPTLYEKFGFRFDHIYAFEVTRKDPKAVYNRVPQQMMSAYHWINVGIEAISNHKLNPWTLIKDQYSSDDVVIVKLDVDNPKLENVLVAQLLEDEKLWGIVDHFYFEHHVHLLELSEYWGPSMEGSVKDSLQLFHKLRQKGIPAHFWV